MLVKLKSGFLNFLATNLALYRNQSVDLLTLFKII